MSDDARAEAGMAGEPEAPDGQIPEGGPSVAARPRAAHPRGVRSILFAARLVFLALVVATPALVISSRFNPYESFPYALVIGLTIATGAIGCIVVAVDAITPNKSLASIFGVYLGICLGLVGAYFIGSILDTIIEAWALKDTDAALYIDLAKISIGCILCYVAVSVVMTTKDNYRIVLPYVEFARENRGIQPLLLDTSAIIDGRIVDVFDSGVLDAPVIVAQGVIDELQRLADSADRTRRSRGRRGLDVIARMQAAPAIDLSIEPHEIQPGSVDRRLVEIARRSGYRLVTTDSALAKVAAIAGVPVVNVHALATALRAQALAGDRLEVEVVRVGEQPNQGVGYLADGTMVVVENGSGHVGSSLSAVVTNVRTTTAGRLIFARADGPEADVAAEPVAETGTPTSMAARATGQERHRGDPPRRDPDGRTSGRNPRRT